MSKYLNMWKKINKMTAEQVKEVVDAISPCTGALVSFKGISVIDSDLLEALKYVVEYKGRK